jgi:hypothetical protein
MIVVWNYPPVDLIKNYLFGKAGEEYKAPDHKTELDFDGQRP